MGVKNTEIYELDGQNHDFYYCLSDETRIGNPERIELVFDVFLSKEVSDSLKGQYKIVKGRIIEIGVKNIPIKRVRQITVPIRRYTEQTIDDVITRVENQRHRDYINAIGEMAYTDLKSYYNDLLKDAIDC